MSNRSRKSGDPLSDWARSRRNERTVRTELAIWAREQREEEARQAFFTGRLDRLHKRRSRVNIALAIAGTLGAVVGILGSISDALLTWILTLPLIFAFSPRKKDFRDAEEYENQQSNFEEFLKQSNLSEKTADISHPSAHAADNCGAAEAEAVKLREAADARNWLLKHNSYYAAEEAKKAKEAALSAQNKN